MSRRYSAGEKAKRARAKHELALERSEFRYPSQPREAAAGATSFPLKVSDPEVDRLIREYQEKVRR